MKESKICDLCGQSFIPLRSTQHYCRRKITRRCLICNDEFETNCSPDGKLVCNKPECKKQGGQVCNPVERICKQCGQEFTTIYFKQLYCKEEKEKACPVCGKLFMYICDQNAPTTCGDVHCQASFIKQKRRSNIATETRICKWCGSEFHPMEVRDVYCQGPHYKKCAICGKDFEIDVRKEQEVETCSKECMGKLMSQNHDYEKGVETQKKVLLEKYGVENAAQIPGVQAKMKATCLEKYGKEWYTQTDEYKQRAKETNMSKYGVEYALQAEEVINKRIKTCLDKYGKGNVLVSDFGIAKAKETMMQKYGTNHPMNVPEIRRKVVANSRYSKLEHRICKLFNNYKIEYKQQYLISNNIGSHLFDFYLPKYSILIDADGLYYHSYLDDPNGKQVREDYDEIRLALIPKNYRFYLIVEGEEDDQIKELIQMLESAGQDFNNYDSELFKWCRSIEFPYPEYSEDRMKKDFNSLVNYVNENYVPQCRLGQSIVKNFHKSIYHSRVAGLLSPYEGWHDDAKLKQVIKNRFIYKNDVDPSKVLAGFNISKICPCVSTFNPVLTKYLITKYLNEYTTIFDPFSGFSGRLIGAAACNKHYIGQDLNEIAVEESNNIIDFLNLNKNNYSIINKDIFESTGDYECLLTCPPYATKEIYSEETIFKTCDGWIEECLDRFNCKKYVFVVDKTEKFKNSIVEELKVSSHLNNVVEYVVVI